MLNYILRRSIAMPFILLGIVTMAFLLTAITKGDPLTAVVSEQQMNNPEIVAAARQRWGLDRPLPERYLIYVGNLLKGDMGTSFVTRRPVSADLVARLPATFELVIAAMIIGSVIGIVFGLLAAYYRDTATDQGARIFSLFGSSVPIFWLGLALLFLLSVKYQILPGPGRIDPRLSPPPAVTGFMTIDTLLAGNLTAFKDALAHLVLPSVVLGWT
ncbi:ABC transporter permease, partial [Mesorhizobium sp. M2A.F.Ca.ET.040.01.1.1]